MCVLCILTAVHTCVCGVVNGISGEREEKHRITGQNRILTTISLHGQCTLNQSTTMLICNSMQRYVQVCAGLRDASVCTNNSMVHSSIYGIQLMVYLAIQKQLLFQIRINS